MTKSSSEMQQDGQIVKTTTEVTTTTVVKKPISPFAKFRQLDHQNSVTKSPTNAPKSPMTFSMTPSSPKTPTTPGTPGSSNAMFTFTDPSMNARAATVKEILLTWCQMKTKEYENVNIENFSSSWTDGLAFCALIHHFLPDTFDYSKLNPQMRRANFTLAFKVAEEKADIYPLLEVDDLVKMKKYDWKCIFTYVQSIYRRFKNCD